MKKFLSYILLVSVLSLNSLTFVFAGNTDPTPEKLGLKNIAGVDESLTKYINTDNTVELNSLNSTAIGNGNNEKMQPKSNTGIIIRSLSNGDNSNNSGTSLKNTSVAPKLGDFDFGVNTNDIAKNNNLKEGKVESISKIPNNNTLSTISLQNIYSCNVIVGGSCTYYLQNASTKRYQSDNVPIVGLAYSSTSYIITGKAIGIARIYVNDIYGNNIDTIYLNVTAPLPVEVSGSTNITLKAGEKIYMNITSGNGGYRVATKDASISSISLNGAGIYIEGITPGNTYVGIIDSAGKGIIIYVNVIPRDLKTTIGTYSVQNGGSTYLTINEGNGGYTVTSSNTSVATVSGYDRNWTLYGKGVGTSTVTVKDSKNITSTFTFTVTSKNLIVSTKEIKIDKGNYGYFSITDGNGGYTIETSSSNLGVYENGSSTSFKVYSNTTGIYVIKVKDSAGIVAGIAVKVYNPLTVSKSSFSLYNGSTESFSITSGNGGYTLTSSNTNVATVSLNGTIGTITAKGVGTTTITLKDSTGKSLSLNVEVKEKNYAQITTLQYNSSINTNGMGGIYFEVAGKYKEVGVEYYYGINLHINKEILSIESDNVYSVAYDLTCERKDSYCKINLRPYVIDIAGNKIYYKTLTSNNYISIGYGDIRYALLNVGGKEQSKIIELNDSSKFVLPSDYKEIEKKNITLETQENRNITIDNRVGIALFTGDISATWKQIKADTKNFAEKNKGLYDGTIDAINDQIAELRPLLDTETYKLLAKELKKLALRVINGEYDVNAQVEKLKTYFAEAYAILDTARKYLSELTLYETQYYGSYLTVSSSATFIGPGKVKGANAVKKMTDKAKEVIVKGFAKKWTASLKKHIFNGEINSKGDAVGVHSKIAVNNKTARFEGTKTNLGKGFYNSYVRVFDKTLYNKHKSDYDTFIKNPANKGKPYKGVAKGDWGWKKKKDQSTFFPDSWSEEKIKEEIAWANGNMKGGYLGNRIVYRGKTSEGFSLEFNFNTDGSISSVYGNFNQDFNSVNFNLPGKY